MATWGRVARRDVEDDPNYRAWMAEREALWREYGNCVVAYSKGQRVALAKDLDEIFPLITDLMDAEAVLIQDISEKVIYMGMPCETAEED